MPLDNTMNSAMTMAFNPPQNMLEMLLAKRGITPESALKSAQARQNPGNLINPFTGMPENYIR